MIWEDILHRQIKKHGNAQNQTADSVHRNKLNQMSAKPERE